MLSKLIFITTLFFMFTRVANGQTKTNEQEPISLFGSKPIQLSVDQNGIHRNNKPGYICKLTSLVSNIKYSQWGETEKDAKTLVKKECDKKSGLLLCKEDKITCQQEK